MKLEVEMYVRTKRGQIGKIVTIGRDDIAIEFNRMWCDIFHKENIVKSSFDIIDLIEAGDYVNGEKIDYISISKDGKKRPLIRDNIYFFDKYKSINSIVTKEQFKQITYKIGE